MNKLLFLCVFSFCLISLKAQNAKNKNNAPQFNKNKQTDEQNFIPDNKLSRFSVGIGYGGTYFLGDIPIDALYAGFGGWVKYSLGHVVSVRLSSLHGRITGSPTTVRDKMANAWFNTLTTTLTPQLLFNLGGVDFRNGLSKNNFYTGFGTGLIFLSSKRDFPELDGSIVRRKVTEQTTSLVFGYKRKITNNFDIGFESSFHFALSDMIDLYKFNIYPDMHGYGVFSLTYNITTKNRPKHIDWFNPVNKIYKKIDDSKKETIDIAKLDDDGDGIPNYLDQEPNTKKGYKVDVKGVTLDSDVDGIPDSEDPDPYGFNQVVAKYFPDFGPQLKLESNIFQFSDSIPKTEFVTLSATGAGLPVVSFPPNGFTLHVEQYPLLQQIARIMIADTSAYLVVIGHSDNAREDITQITLAEKRALEVKRKLAKIYELEEDRMLVFSVKDPYIKKYNLGTEGLNRKVEFRIIRPKR
ncbi:MAG: OmpA family protein [Bacteroidia bacterium]